MQPISLFLMAVGLSMDCFAVSVSDGVIARRAPLARPLTLAFFFGTFQSLMAMAGWLLGGWASSLIAAADHWIAFALLAAVGGKMFYEACRGEEKPLDQTLTFWALLALSVATSIDALAVGISLSCLHASIFDPVVIIGLTTFVLSLSGVYLGRILGHVVGNRFEMIGAVILVSLGVKILVEHQLL
jgi:putative Mn2+ efflux pump MntP